MSKYELLWNYIANRQDERILLSFEEIKTILGFEIDHSFLLHKKELNEFGYQVKKISLKQKNILFIKNSEN